MFGYVVVNKPELKIKDFDLYQSFYCGLCRLLHTEYGRIAQISLNYDMTFLAILLTGLYEPNNVIVEERCVIHPVYKHKKIDNAYLAYAADMTIVLTYLKCEDDWEDDRSKRGFMMRSLLKRKYHRVADKYPDKVARIENALHKTSELEQAGVRDLDQLSKLTGIVLGEIMSYQEDVWQKTLYEVGDYMGRFIYIMDAYDDLEDDRKHQVFNPFAKEEMNEAFDARVKDILELLISHAADAFETLPILEHIDILRNILYSGIWTKYEMVRKKRSGENDG